MPISTAHIFHELDQLKKRIKEEQHQQQSVLVERDSEADPETESEAEVEDVLDEREEELEKAREEVMVAKQTQEQLVEDAETRYDNALSEKEKVERSLSEYKQQVAESAAEKRVLETDLQKARQSAEELRKQVGSIEESLGAYESNLKEIKADQEKSKASLAATDTRIAELEAENKNAWEELLRTRAERDSGESALKDDLKVLQDANQDLQKKLSDAQSVASRAEEEHAARARDLDGQIDKHKASLEEALRKVDQYSKDSDRLSKDHHSRQARIEELTREVEQHKETIGLASQEKERIGEEQRKQLKNAQLSHQQAIREIESKHETEREQLQDQLHRAESANNNTLEDVKSSHARTLEDTRAEHSTVLARLKAEHDEQIRIVNDQLSEARRGGEDARDQHVSEIKALKAEHGDQIQASSHRLGDLKRRFNELQDQLSAQTEQSDSLRAQLSQDDESHRASVQKLEAALRNAEGQLAASLASVNEKEATSRAHLEDKNNVIAQLQQEFSESREKAKAQNTAYERKVQDLSQRLESQLMESQQANALSLEAVNNRHAQSLESLRRAHAADLTRAGEEAKTATSALEAKHSKALSELQDRHQKALEDSTSKADGRFEHLEAAHGREMQSLREEHSQAIEKLNETHAQSLKEANEVAEQRLQQHEKVRKVANDAFAQVKQLGQEKEKLSSDHAAALDNHRAELSQLQKGHEVTIGDLKAAHEKVLADTQESSQNQFRDFKQQAKRARAEHEKAISQIQSDHVSQTSDLRTKHDSVVAELRKEVDANKARLAGAEADHERSVSDLRASHAEDVNALKQKHDAEREALQSELSKGSEEASSRANVLQASYDGQLADLKAAHSSEITALQSTLEAQRTQHEAALAANAEKFLQVKSEHDAALNDLKLQHQRDLELLRDSHSKSSLETNEGHATAVANLKAEHVTQTEVLQAEHNRQILQHQQEHDDAISSLKASHGKELEDLRQTRSLGVKEMQQKHEAEIANHKNTATSELEKVRQEHASALGMADKGHNDAVRQLESQHESKLKAVSVDHEKHLSDVRRTMDEEHKANLHREMETGKAALSDANKVHERAMISLRQELANMQDSHAQTLQTRLFEAETQRSQHERILQESANANKQELESLRAAHEEALKSQLDQARAVHEDALRDQDTTWTTRMSDLKKEHEKAFAQVLKTSDESSASSLKQLEQRHVEALEKAVTEARDEANARLTAAEQQHRAALEAAVDKARQSSQAEIRNLKNRHKDAVGQIRALNQKQAAAQLTDLEVAHKNELESASKTHQEEIARVQSEHSSQLADLRSRMLDESTTDTASKKSLYDSEIAALQSRLDASLNGQADAERGVAALRQQLAQADKRVAEAKEAAEEQLVALQRERDDVTGQLEKVQSSLREHQRRSSIGASTPRSRNAREELAALQSQTTTLEEDRATARLNLQKHVDEKNELSRQNDFLVKELEALLAQRSRGRAPFSKKTDALLQTDPVAASEPKVNIAAVQHIKDERRRSLGQRPVTPKTPKTPKTPLSLERRQAKDEIDMAWHTRSFEDYLLSAQTELSELGSVITANENLFAAKIQEHVGELQRAKDQLAADYKTRLEGLTADKEHMEQMVTSQHANAFAKERKKLVARYGADYDEPNAADGARNGLPVGDAYDLRTAEESLVQDFNRRIAKRKSQIALKHAEEFQNVTREYDRKVAELLTSRRKLEGDLSVDPSQFEQEYDELQGRSTQLQSAQGHMVNGNPDVVQQNGGAVEVEEPLAVRQPRSLQRPKTAARTSNPRTSTSIPRSTSLPRGSYDLRRVSPEPTPAVPRIYLTGKGEDSETPAKPRRGSVQHQPVTQRSLMRAKGPQDYAPEQRRVVSVPPPVTPGKPGVAGKPTVTPTRSSSKAARTMGIGSLAAELQSSTQTNKSAPPVPTLNLPGSKDSPTAKPGLFRRVRDRFSTEGHKHHSQSRSRPGSRSESQRYESHAATAAATSITPERKNGIDNSTPTAPQQGTEQEETGLNSNGLPKRDAQRTRSKKLSSGMIYYNNPRQSLGPPQFDD